MDIRLDNTSTALQPAIERKTVDKQKRQIREPEGKEEDRSEVKTARETAPEPVVISKEELQDFMLLLTTSKSSPRLFDRFVDEKRKGRIDTLLNTRI